MSILSQSLLYSAIAIILAGIGVGLGFLLRRYRRLWMLGFFIPMTLVLVYGMTRWHPPSEFWPICAFLTQGRLEYYLFGISSAWLFTSLLLQTDKTSLRRLLGVFLVIVVVQFSLLPFLAPVFVYSSLQQIKTQWTPEGVCLQSNDYNCGPAAVATGLRRLGVEGQEKDLALEAFASKIYGTMPDVLVSAIGKLYGDQVNAQYRVFKETSEMEGNLPVVAIIKYSFTVDHYVTILQIKPGGVRVGDPLTGEVLYSHQDFNKVWRKTGIILKKKPTSSHAP